MDGYCNLILYELLTFPHQIANNFDNNHSIDIINLYRSSGQLLEVLSLVILPTSLFRKKRFFGFLYGRRICE